MATKSSDQQQQKKLVIDLRELGGLTTDCNRWLDKKLKEALLKNLYKCLNVCKIQDDQDWDFERLYNFFVSEHLKDDYTRITLTVNDGKIPLPCCLDWLTGLLTTYDVTADLQNGEENILTQAEVFRILFYFIHPDMSEEKIKEAEWKSTKEELWKDAPKPLRSILEIMETAIITNQFVSVLRPYPRIPDQLMNEPMSMEQVAQFPIDWR